MKCEICGGRCVLDAHTANCETCGQHYEQPGSFVYRMILTNEQRALLQKAARPTEAKEIRT